MILKFPELNGGTAQGLNDAGVENFQGAIDVYVSRECGQNTGDALRDGCAKVKLTFDRMEVNTEDIPGFSQMSSTLVACREKWIGKKEREFFDQAIELASKDKIAVLKISDYGTTGLSGGDVEENGRWFALVKSQGVSNKGDTAGGSFGIGKSSPFAASRFRTVFYGTRTGEGQVALQGVSRLVTHKNSDGRLTQGIGFIGDYDDRGGDGGEPVFRAIREEQRIPALFQRKDPGTDIWVVGYRSGAEWSRDLVRSIISNFWPAIHQGSIEFRVGMQEITSKNLADLIAQHVGQDEFESHHLYKAITSQPVEKHLKSVGICQLYLATGEADLPRKICMVRKSGMRIYDYQPRACRVPFSGLFVCRDTDGNKLLRKLEPPKHDTWDAKRIEDGTGKKALDEIKEWIKEEVKKLNPHFSGKSFNEDELAKYIPDNASDENAPPTDQTGSSDEESLDPKVSVRSLQVKTIKAKPLQQSVQAPADDDSRTEVDADGREPEDAGGDSGTSDGGGGGDGTASGGTFGGGTGTGDGGTGDGDADGKDKGGSGEANRPKGSRTTNSATPPNVGVRSYCVGGNQYRLVIRSPKAFAGTMRVFATGEDGRHEPVNISEASVAGPRHKVLVVDGNAIQNVRVNAGVPLQLSVAIGALERRSLTVRLES